MNAVARSFGARLLSFVPTLLGTLIATKLIVSSDGYGVLAFDSFALTLTLINLVPLNNLGVGAAITSALAEERDNADRAARTVLTAARVLAISAFGTAVVSAVLGVTGLWRPLLGEASGPSIWVGLALVVYAVSFLPGLGQSMLLGVHRNHTTILVQTIFNPLNALFVAVIVLTGATSNALVIVPCASLVIVNVLTSYLAARATGISWRSIAYRLPRRRRFPGAKIRSMSGPVLIITLATPIALQSDRIVLSHVSTPQAVAEYSVALQIFGPALVLLAASAAPLWPIWTQARGNGLRGPGVLKIVALFTVAGAVGGAVLGGLAGPVASKIFGSDVEIGPMLALVGALWVVVTAMAQPVAMSLMYPGAIKVVVWFTVLALPLNIGLSIVLAREYGAAGPLLATVVVGIAVQVLPGLFYSVYRQRKLPVTAGRHAAGVVVTEVPVEVTVEAGLPVEIDVPVAAAPAAGSRRPSPRPRPGPGVTPAPGFTSIDGYTLPAPDPYAVKRTLDAQQLQPVARFLRPDRSASANAQSGQGRFGERSPQ